MTLPHPPKADPSPFRIVIVGGGFGGLECAKALSGADCDVVLVDRQNHHCFQPLLYQVAVAALAPGDVASPIRSVLRRARNVRVVMVEVTGIDRDAAVVQAGPLSFPYDALVLATGATHTYFGHDHWGDAAPGLKRAEDAVQIRNRLLSAFERAEIETNPDRRRALLTFVVIGGGPTGVEMAGAISDLARDALPADYRTIDPRQARIVLIEAQPRLLAAFPKHLAQSAREALERRGVEILLSHPVTDVCEGQVCLGTDTIAADTIVWAAGVRASPAARWLFSPSDRAGRVIVGPDLALPTDPSIFVIGDTASVMNGGAPVPALAPAAKQMGRYVGRLLRARTSGKGRETTFRYRHGGDLATIGGGAAIVKLGPMELTGWLGWLFWSVAHVYFLIGVRNRIAVAFSWAWDYVTSGRKARLILQAPETGPPPKSVDLPGR